MTGGRALAVLALVGAACGGCGVPRPPSAPLPAVPRAPASGGAASGAAASGGVASGAPAPGGAASGTAASGDLVPGAVVDVAGFDVAERAAVRVRDVQCSSGVATGSGFALDAHTLVTNRHVVADAARVQVDTYDGHELAVTSVAVSESADLAVLHTRQALPATLVLAGPGDAADPAPGQPVSVVGYPLGGQLATRRGTVSGTGPDPLATMTAPVLDLAVPVAPGSSGSPVLDAAGRVVGVVYAGAEGGSTSYAVPVSVLAAALATLRSTGRAPACG